MNIGKTNKLHFREDETLAEVVKIPMQFTKTHKFPLI